MSTPRTAGEGLVELLATHRVVPVLTIGDAERGRQLAASLHRGGLPVAEVTLRTDGALAALAAMASTGDVLVGAGTVTTTEQVDAVVDAGAGFVVSPGLGHDVVQRCRERGVPVLPGVATASEMMQALALGIDVVKLFPANLVGGPAGVRAFSAPFPGLRFVPTGGVRPEQLPDYLSHPAVPAVGGSWIAPPDLVGAKRWDEIEARARQAVELARAVQEKES